MTPTVQRIKGTPNLFMRSYLTSRREKRTLYYVRFRCWKGRDRWIAAGETLVEAKGARDRIMQLNRQRHDFDQQETPNVTLSDWAARWLELQRHKRSYRRYELACRPLIQQFGSLAIASLTASRIERYKQQRLGEKTRTSKAPAPATINRELQCLKSMLILAERDGILTRRPHLTMLDEHNTRDRTATPGEYQAIYQAMPPHMRPALVLMRELGMRVSEVVTLKAEQIDWLTREIRLLGAGTKTKRNRTLPMNDQVEAALRSVTPGEGGRLFWHQHRLAKAKPMTRQHVHEHFRRACRKLGIEGLWVHDLRGTFATEKLEQGYDRALVRRITGHTTDSAFERYVRPKQDAIRRVVEKPGTVH